MKKFRMIFFGIVLIAITVSLGYSEEGGGSGCCEMPQTCCTDSSAGLCDDGYWERRDGYDWYCCEQYSGNTRYKCKNDSPTIPD